LNTVNLRSTVVRLSAILGFFLISAETAFPGGFEGPGLGARATAMGGAFIAVADDWTAIYWNPAGLSQLKGSGVGLFTEYVQSRSHDDNGLANPTQAQLSQANVLRGDPFVQSGGEPSQFNGRDSVSRSFLPAVGFYTHWKGFALAVGSYNPLGFSFDVSDRSIPGYDVSFKSSGYVLTHNVSVAREVYKGVRLGAGVNVLQAHLDRFSYKEAPAMGDAYSSSSKSDGLGVQGIFGVLVDLGSRWRLGGVYRTGSDISMNGELSVSDSLLPGPLQNEKSSFTQKERNPATAGIGLSFLATPALTLAADWQRTQWSASRLDIGFDQPGALMQNQSLDAGWSSTNRYRFGLEWRPLERWSFRAGYFRDPQAVAFPSQSLTQLIDVNQHYYTAGFSYRINRWRWTVAEQYSYGKEVFGGQTLRREATSSALAIEYFF
jgi:long-chain fatty acid transport protein